MCLRQINLIWSEYMHSFICEYLLQWYAIRSCCLDYNDQSSHTSIIRANYVYLLETLDVKFSGLVGQLYSDHVVSEAERDEVSTEQTSFRANEKLLSVLSRKSPQQFQLFLDALDKCGQRHVRTAIDDLRGLSIKTIENNDAMYWAVRSYCYYWKNLLVAVAILLW